MPIETTETGAIVVTGDDGMLVYRLAALRSALKLAMVGIKVHRSVNAVKLAKEATGLKTNDKQKLLEAVEKLLEDAQNKCERK